MSERSPIAVEPSGAPRRAAAGRRAVRALALALALSLAAALCACGGSDPDERPATSAAPAPGRAAAPLPPEEQAAALASEGQRTGLPPEAAVPAEDAAAPAPRPAGFWATIDDARVEAGGDVEDAFEQVWARLHRQGPSAMRAFADELRRRDEALYTWEMWGAATVAEDGCSDDCFADFRTYVISLGPEAYEAARHDPDALAALMPDDADWGDAHDSMTESYEALAGEDPPGADGPDGEPRGRPWDSDDVERLRQRYPELDERFG